MTQLPVDTAPTADPAPLVLTSAQLRQVDARAISELGLTGIVLMENAGRHVAEWMLRLGIHGEVVVVAGKGNNGGDGYVIARQLLTRGCQVRVVSRFAPGDLTGDARANALAWVRCGGPFDQLPPEATPATWAAALAGADWIVDALLGTGMKGPVRPEDALAIDAINAAGARVMAVDLPSGFDPDTGEVSGTCVRAHHTATFVAWKPGFVCTASNNLGQTLCFDVGIPRVWVEGLFRGV
jgi:NAD(P)H-hydrate epimerase